MPILVKAKIENRDRLSVYPFFSKLFRDGFTVEFDPITIIAGENGVGKSTFLESLAHSIGFSSFGGGINHTTILGGVNYAIVHGNNPWETLKESAEEDDDLISQIDDCTLSDYMKLSWQYKTKKGWFVRAETFAALVSIGLKDFYAGDRSHGEGIVDVLNGIEQEGIYILDEPESGLSPSKMMQMMLIISQKQKQYGAQFIISTHNPMLMSIPGAKLLYMTTDEIKRVAPEETPHFQLTKYFLNNPEGFVNKLFSDDE